MVGTGIWSFTPFPFILNMVHARDLEHLAVERGGGSALYIISVRGFGTGKTVWLQVYLFNQGFKLSRALCQVWVRADGTERVCPVSKPWCPSLCILGLTSEQRGDRADISRSRHNTNHYNWRAWIATSHHERVRHFHGLYPILTLILEFCRWENWEMSNLT